MQAIVAKLTAEDGITIHTIERSSFIRESLSAKGFALLPNPNLVMNLVKKHHAEVTKKTKLRFEELKKKGDKFSIILDEYTSMKNRRYRYLNINVHHTSDQWNLGLVQIHGSFPAQKINDAVSKKLEQYGISHESDVVASTSDGAAVRTKF